MNNNALYVTCQSEGKHIIAIRNGDSETYAVAGVMKKTELFNIDLTERLKKILIRAVNNRTRERNYFKLYCEMLDGIITEEDFDKEIDSHEDKYVINQNEDASIEDIELALEIYPDLMDVKDPNDMAEVFSFSDKSMQKSIR